MNKPSAELLRLVPGVDRLLKDPRLAEASRTFGRELVKFSVQQALEEAREAIRQNNTAPDPATIIADAERRCRAIANPSLRAVLNATGILVHTNLGRAPLGEQIFDEMRAAVTGYSNLEFDLETGTRGHRNTHLDALLCFITGAEAAIVVNNNAAALVLSLGTLAHQKEVIISRGELVEIGGSFRIPDILAASGARMIEVGTTNRTRLSDYENAITPATAFLLKAHKSNYAIKGFTEEPSLAELVSLGRAKGVPVLFDMGSGLLRKPAGWPLADEPDVKSALAEGIDLITFSGDKLLGGPQAGIIAGRRDLVNALAKAPLMRALRVGKLTIAALGAAVRAYLNDERLAAGLPLFAMMRATPAELADKAERLSGCFARRNIATATLESIGRCGGGSLPDLEIKSFAVAVKTGESSQQRRSATALRLFHALLRRDRPILAVLRQGELVFDVLTLRETDFEEIAAAVSQAFS
jgi:L-seryl-tRNA(Ser) seleniumtransferase